MSFVESCQSISELTLNAESRCRDLHQKILPKLGEQCDLAVPLVRDCMKGADEAKKFCDEIKPISAEAKDFAEQFMRASEECLKHTEELVEAVNTQLTEVKKGCGLGIIGACFGCASEAAGQQAPNRVDTTEDREEVDGLAEKVENGALEEMKTDGAEALELVGGPRRENLRIGYMTMMSITEIIRNLMSAIEEKDCIAGMKQWKHFSRLAQLADVLKWFAEELLRLAKCIYAFLEMFWKKVSNLEVLVFETIVDVVKDLMEGVGLEEGDGAYDRVVDVAEGLEDDMKNAMNMLGMGGGGGGVPGMGAIASGMASLEQDMQGGGMMGMGGGMPGMGGGMPGMGGGMPGMGGGMPGMGGGMMDPMAQMQQMQMQQMQMMQGGMGGGMGGMPGIGGEVTGMEDGSNVRITGS